MRGIWFGLGLVAFGLNTVYAFVLALKGNPWCFAHGFLVLLLGASLDAQLNSDRRTDQ